MQDLFAPATTSDAAEPEPDQDVPELEPLDDDELDALFARLEGGE